MKKIAVFCLFIFKFVVVNAQVTNDSCLSAINLDTIRGTNLSGCFFGGPNFSISDSTENAQANFPYPQIPTPCIGYLTSPLPLNDVWYKFYAKCELEFAVISSDTLCISFWYGPNCASLFPLNCYTIPANQNYYTTVNITLPDTFGLHWMQITGTTLGQSSNFNICLTAPQFVCSSTFTFVAQTNLLCFNYSAVKTDCTTPSSNDGIIDINIIQGNAPFTCLWTDGNTSFNRTGLAPGNYYFTLMDINGCSETDSVIINFPTGLNDNLEFNFDIQFDSELNCFIITIPDDLLFLSKEFTFCLNDIMGKLIYKNDVSINSKIIRVYLEKRVSSAIYCAILRSKEILIKPRKLFVAN